MSGINVQNCMETQAFNFLQKSQDLTIKSDFFEKDYHNRRTSRQLWK